LKIKEKEILPENIFLGKLYQITVPHFCAGIIFTKEGLIWKTAPILLWMKRKHMNLTSVKNYCVKKHWKMEYIK